MKIAGLACCLLFAAPVAMAASQLATADCNFGEKYAFNRAECELTFTNSGDKPIRVSSFQPMRPNDAVEPTEITVGPRAKAYVKAIVDTGNDVGNSRHVFRFHSDEAGHQDRLIVARGFALSALDEGRPMVDLGVVDMAADLPSRTVNLSSHDVADFRIEKIISKPDYVDAEIAADKHSVSVKMRPNAPWGYRGDYVKLATNAAIQKEVWIGVQADFHGDVIPSSNPYNLGVMRAGSSNEQLIRLTSRDGKAFSIGKIELDQLHGSATIQACTPETEGCKLVKLHLSDEQPIGSVIGKIDVSVPSASQHILIAVNGIFLDKDAKIEKVDVQEVIEKSHQKDGVATVASPSVDINKAIKSAVQASDEVAPAGKGPLLKWSVVNESIIHGYQIFRASDEKGPFVLLNRETLPPKNHDNSGSAYQWRDNDAESGKSYWYYIGIVYGDGHKQQLTGPQKVLAK